MKAIGCWGLVFFLGAQPSLSGAAAHFCAGAPPSATSVHSAAKRATEPRQTAYALVLFAHFRDELPEQTPIPSWAGDIFDPNRPGSFTHFYNTMSFQQHQVRGEVASKRYASAKPAASYLATAADSLGGFGRFNGEILQQADDDIDFARFDNDGPDGRPNSGDDDGVVDAVFVVTASAPRNFLLGGATGFGGLGLAEDFVTDDLGTNGQPLRISGAQGTIQQGRTFAEAAGVMCHEYGHVLGLPDLFNTAFLGLEDADPQEDSAGIGRWGLMGWGATGWNGDNGPNSFCAWSRMRLGWALVRDSEVSEEDIHFEPVGRGGAILRVPLGANEFFLLEYRTRAGTYYDRTIPGEGLLIWHVVEGAVEQSLGNVPRVDLECADGRWRDRGYPLGQDADPQQGEDNLDFWAHDGAYATAHQGNLGDATDPFDGVRFTAFTPQTNPAAYRTDGLLSVQLEQIGLEQGMMRAQVGILPLFAGGLILRNRGDLELLSAFEEDLFGITGDLLVDRSSLLSLEELSGLRLISGFVRINRNRALTSLVGLDQLLHIGGTLEIWGNENLPSLGGLHNLRRVEGDLMLNTNIRLSSLSGLEQLTRVKDDLILTANPSMRNLSALHSLTQVGGDLILTANARLSSLSGLEGLIQVEALKIENNASLSSLSGLEQLTRVEGDLTLTANASLSSLSGLSALEHLGGSLKISGGAMTSLDGLNRLRRIEGDLLLTANETLTSLSGLSALEHLGGSLKISGGVMTSLDGLNRLRRIEGDLILTANARLSSLSGLEQLTHLGGSLKISGGALASLDGLNRLGRIEGDLILTANASLSSLSGLSALEHLGGELVLSDKRLLTRLSRLSTQFKDRVRDTGFSPPIYFSTGGASINNVLAADLDGDGDRDLVITKDERTAISVWFNSGDATFAKGGEYKVRRRTNALVAADLDGDGDQDLVAGGQGSSVASVLLNRGDGTFADRVNYPTGGGSINNVIAADLDGDGDRDLVAGGQGSSMVSVLLNRGDGTFAGRVNYPTGGSSINNVIAADLDGDGDRDLAVSNSSMNRVSVLLNRGDGTFADKVDYPTGGSSINNVLAADLDGDGDRDLAVSNSSMNRVSVLLNRGDGTFADKVDYAAGEEPWGVMAADLDGDGDQDLALGYRRGGAVSVLSNRGDGTFADKVDHIVSKGSGPVMAADLDGDGDQDLVMGDVGGGTVTMLLNLSSTPTAVLEREARDFAGPESFFLLQNYPNPFNSGTVLSFTLPQGGPVNLAIYNLLGQRVINLVDGIHQDGNYTIHWDGRDEQERDLASGLYVYRLQAGGHVQMRKLILLR